MIAKKFSLMFFFMGLSFSLQAASLKLENYNELVSALSAGHRVNAVINVKRCIITEFRQRGKETTHPNAPGDDIILGLNFNDDFFMVEKESQGDRFFVVTISNHTFYTDPIYNGAGQSINNKFKRRYKLLRVFDDNSAHLQFATYDERGLLISGDYQCSLAKVNAGGAVYLFDKG